MGAYRDADELNCFMGKSLHLTSRLVRAKLESTGLDLLRICLIFYLLNEIL